MKNRHIDYKNLGLLFRLGRLPNLLIIIGTQLLLRYCILVPFVYAGEPQAVSPLTDFLLLVLITALLTIAGYIINDYFDRKIDAINRPDKQVMNRLVSPHGAIKLHMILNILAVVAGFWLAWEIKSFTFGLIFPFISGLLWLYSAKYKRTLIWGNLIVSLLSAFVVLIVWLFEFFWLRLNPEVFVNVLPDMQWVSKIFLAYAIFAFLITLITEIVKDLEDVEGDAQFGLTTLPLKVGLRFTRFIAAGITVMAMLLLGYCQFILDRLNFDMLVLYFLVAVQIPSIYLLFLLFRANSKSDYKNINALCKVIAVAGLLSMEILFISI